MELKLLILLFSVYSINAAPQSTDFQDLSTLGERISAQINANLEPLSGLGERINKQVQESLIPVQTQIKELDGLGDRISLKVNEELEPVRALEITERMKWGYGGITVATHSPSGKKIIYKNYKRYVCPGTIDDSTGACTDGELTAFSLTKSSSRTDYCFITNAVIQFNNQICIGDTDAVLNQFGSNFICGNSIDGRPSLTLSIDDYKKLCEPVSATIEYRYYPDLKDTNHVEIPNKNKHVKCENEEGGFCLFSQKNGLLDLKVSSLGTGGFSIFNFGY